MLRLINMFVIVALWCILEALFFSLDIFRIFVIRFFAENPIVKPKLLSGHRISFECTKIIRISTTKIFFRPLYAKKLTPVYKTAVSTTKSVIKSAKKKPLVQSTKSFPRLIKPLSLSRVTTKSIIVIVSPDITSVGW